MKPKLDLISLAKLYKDAYYDVGRALAGDKTSPEYERLNRPTVWNGGYYPDPTKEELKDLKKYYEQELERINKKLNET